MRTVAALCRELLPDRRTDGELLAAFTADRSEPCFLELVKRHGPLVWGVCRRVLPHPADAEDAFQATFLVLVQRAAKVRHRDALGPWLHQVAVLTARNVRRKNARRLARQRELPDDLPQTCCDSDLTADLDGALLGLPARLRDPIILCHLQGFTRREAAERLGCPEGTLSAWLNRGLARLRVHLRDLDPTKAFGVAGAVPVALTASTARAVASGVAAAAVPPAVSSLVEGALHMFWVKKATAASFALVAVFALGVGTGLGTRPNATGAVAEDGPPKPATAPEPADVAKEIARLEESIRVTEMGITSLEDGVLFLKDSMTAEEYARYCEKVAVTVAQAKELKRHWGEQIAELRTAELKGEYGRLLERLKRLPPADRESERGRAMMARVLELSRQIEDTSRGRVAAAKIDHLVLTVGGKANAPEFALREVPADDKGGGWKKTVGPVVTADRDALVQLLARAKADPNGPRAVHVVAEPQTTFGLGARHALEACDVAGYPTVTFTGYAVQNWDAAELKPSHIGDAPNYKRFDRQEGKATEFAAEVGKWLRW